MRLASPDQLLYSRGAALPLSLAVRLASPDTGFLLHREAEPREIRKKRRAGKPKAYRKGTAKPHARSFQNPQLAAAKPLTIAHESFEQG